MLHIKNPSIKLKEELNQYDYNEINNLKNICLEIDKTSLKLELDYKLNRKKLNNKSLGNINEFMYYDGNDIIGYIGICQFGSDTVEVNGMVHPDYRRKGVFKKLFSYVKYEWISRNSQNVLLLSDSNSISGIQFIKDNSTIYDHSEYEMFLKQDVQQNSNIYTVKLRNATIKDSKEIARQNSIYFDTEYNGEDFPLDEDNVSLIYIAEVNNEVVGKVHLEINDEVGGIYGLGVLPEYRSNGYARQILSISINKLKEKGTREIMLQVSVTNRNALNLYKSCGFEETSTMDYYKISKLLLT